MPDLIAASTGPAPTASSTGFICGRDPHLNEGRRSLGRLWPGGDGGAFNGVRAEIALPVSVVLRRWTVALLSVQLLFGIFGPAVARGDGAGGSEDRSGVPFAVTAPLTDSGALAPPRPQAPALPHLRTDEAVDVPSNSIQESLLQAALYEKDGRLQFTDTTLRLRDGAFSMDTARYQTRATTKLVV